MFCDDNDFRFSASSGEIHTLSATFIFNKKNAPTARPRILREGAHMANITNERVTNFRIIGGMSDLLGGGLKDIFADFCARICCLRKSKITCKEKAFPRERMRGAGTRFRIRISHPI